MRSRAHFALVALSLRAAAPSGSARSLLSACRPRNGWGASSPSPKAPSCVACVARHLARRYRRIWSRSNSRTSQGTAPRRHTNSRKPAYSCAARFDTQAMRRTALERAIVPEIVNACADAIRPHRTSIASSSCIQARRAAGSGGFIGPKLKSSERWTTRSSRPPALSAGISDPATVSENTMWRIASRIEGAIQIAHKIAKFVTYARSWHSGTVMGVLGRRGGAADVFKRRPAGRGVEVSSCLDNN